jgi:hypothetical protein
VNRDALDAFFAEAEDVLTDWRPSGDAMIACVPEDDSDELAPHGDSYYDQPTYHDGTVTYTLQPDTSGWDTAIEQVQRRNRDTEPASRRGASVTFNIVSTNGPRSRRHYLQRWVAASHGFPQRWVFGADTTDSHELAERARPSTEVADPRGTALYAYMLAHKDAIWAQRHAALIENHVPLSIAVPARFGEDIINGATLYGLPLVAADVVEPEVRSARW